MITVTYTSFDDKDKLVQQKILVETNKVKRFTLDIKREEEGKFISHEVLFYYLKKEEK